MKRLLALDGGGIRGIFTLEVLARMEALLRAKTGRPALVLADYFDYIAGTSTGGIIATCLSWGMPVAEIEDLYIRRGMDIFRPAPWYKRWRSKYAAEAITAMLKEVFAEDAAGQVPALLGTRKLRTLLCLVMRNYSTGSPWPISNNPAAKFNDPASPECNLRIPLWQLVRASTAAPTFFPPETIVLGGRQHVFVDGGITPYNNPSLLLYLMATMPCFHLEWERGLDKLLLVSIGTGRVRVTSGTATAGEMSLLFHARRVPVALIDSSSLQQDLLCRILGQCRVGDEIDCEIGDLKDGGAGANPGLVPGQASGEASGQGSGKASGQGSGKASGQGSGKASGNNFTYLRYNLLFTPEQHARAQQFASTGFAIDNLKLIPLLRDLGAAYAAETVRAEDLL